MSAEHLVLLTLETWRSQGPRTEQRREALLRSYVTIYYGPEPYETDVRTLVNSARLLLRQRTRIDELSYV